MLVKYKNKRIRIRQNIDLNVMEGNSLFPPVTEVSFEFHDVKNFLNSERPSCPLQALRASCRYQLTNKHENNESSFINCKSSTIYQHRKLLKSR